MFRIRVTTPFPEWPLKRQTQNNDGIWKNCKFFFNDEFDYCDYWVVIEGVSKPESVICNKNNTIFITAEPPDIKTYDKSFLDQFSLVITSDVNIEHSNAIHTQQGLQWMIGAEYTEETREWKNFKKFSDIKNATIEKKKLISIVLSNKQRTPAHRIRNRFLDYLKYSLNGELDIYGVGYRPLKDKWDAIVPYKYHLVLENSHINDYWTEKIADAFLGEAYPIYNGCPNITDYFSDGALDIIDLTDFRQASDKIKDIIHSHAYEEKAMLIREEKNKVLYNYNFFSIICDLVNRKGKPFKREDRVTIFPELVSTDSEYQ